MHTEIRQWWVTPSLVLLTLAVFIADFLTSARVNVATLYIVPVVLAVLQRRPSVPLGIAAVSTVFCLLGYLLAPAAVGAQPGPAVLNRLFDMAALWVSAVLVWTIIRSRAAIAHSRWLLTGLSGLAAKVRGDQSTQQVARNALSYLADYVGAPVGVLYSTDAAGGQLRRTANFAFADWRGAHPEILEWGEGLPGQAAAENRLLELADVPPDYLRISSGLGSTAPAQILAMPLHADDQVRGVLELGFLRAPIETARDLLNQAAETIGIAIRSAETRSQLRELLSESQQQAERLQSQQEELRVSNEELEQQSRALQESQARLEHQQAQLEQVNQQLEEQAHALDARNQELLDARDDLRNKAAELEQASQYKSEFLANMSHELRTPLNSLMILARLLANNKNGNLTDEQVEHADTIHSAGRDLLDLINDILDLARVEAGKLEMRPELFPVSRVLKSLEQTFEPLAKDKALSLRVEVDADAPERLTTDRQRLEQILRNFLANAIKFTAEGEVSLRVKTQPDGIAFAVTDTGIGIQESQHETIFEAFRQADGTTNRKYGGTGLGLSVSRELAQRLGGTISVESEPGKGSTFTLQMPLEHQGDNGAPAETPAPKGEQPARPSARASATAAEPARAAAASPEEFARSAFGFEDDRATPSNYTRSILVVEDDERFAKVLYDLAHEMSFSCLVAATGSEGLALAKKHLPTAILLDIRLPDFSGLAILDQLKTNPQTRHIPVHIVSIEDFSRAALHMGAVGFMLKPVERDKLVEAFTELRARMDQEIKRVLVVEDDFVQRSSIVKLVSDAGIELTDVATATEALAKLSGETFDCMIIDLGLPDLSGYELLEKLAEADSPYSYPPVIVYTGRALSREDEERLHRYSDSVIIKGAKSPERLLSEVTLFLHRVESKLPADRQRMLKELRGREAALDRRTILVVDDDVRNIFALKAVLEPHGAIIEIARNGREALAKLDAVPETDLVLMDIMMPEMDGYEAMRQIRAQTRFEELPIIAITAKAMRDDQEQSLAAGANDYLSKPIDVEKLLSLVRVWLPTARDHWR